MYVLRHTFKNTYYFFFHPNNIPWSFFHKNKISRSVALFTIEVEHFILSIYPNYLPTLCFWTFRHDAVYKQNILSLFTCFFLYVHTQRYTSLHNCLIISLGKIPSSGIARLKGMCILTFVTFLPEWPPKRLNICTFLLILHLSLCALCLQESCFCSRLCLFTSEMRVRIQ